MSDRNFYPATTVDEVPPGAKKRVTVNGVDILVCNSKDQLFAVRNLCSHAHETLECGRMKGGWIACPVHGARFDLETGKAMNPPAVVPIETYEVRVTGDTIEVAI